MSSRFLYLFAIAVFFIPQFTHAGPIIRSGEVISIDASQVLKGDFYGLASKVSISGAAEHDAYIGGGTVTINAAIAEDLTVIGGTVHIHGTVGDDVRVVGGEVTIAEEVKGDVVVLGGTLTILSTAKINGDVLFMGGSLVIEGDVVGSVHGTSDTTRINAEVGGNVTLEVASRFALGENANVRGDITYESRSDLIRAQDAVVVGDIRKSEVRKEPDSGFMNIYLFTLGMILFAAGSLYLIAKNDVQKVIARSCHNPGVSGLIGIGVFFAVPVMGSVLLVSILGSLIGVMLIGLYIVLCTVAIILTSVFVGRIGEQIIFKSKEVSLRTIALGAILLVVVGLIPYVGGLLIFAGFIILLGALSQTLYEMIRR